MLRGRSFRLNPVLAGLGAEKSLGQPRAWALGERSIIAGVAGAAIRQRLVTTAIAQQVPGRVLPDGPEVRVPMPCDQAIRRRHPSHETRIDRDFGEESCNQVAGILTVAHGHCHQAKTWHRQPKFSAGGPGGTLRDDEPSRERRADEARHVVHVKAPH